MTTTATKSRPILFSGPMVRAILAGRKTQTRRVIDRVAGLGVVTCFGGSETTGYDFALRDRRDMWNEFREDELLRRCPYGQPGDELWVRETWGEVRYVSVAGMRPRDSKIVYRADDPDDPVDRPMGWNPSIHMPRWASRITLTVKAVRVERLHDISHDDAIAEGILGTKWAEAELTLREQALPLSVLAYSHLWQEINGPDSWDANPWVWVVEFERKAVG